MEVAIQGVEPIILASVSFVKNKGNWPDMMEKLGEVATTGQLLVIRRI